ncbi:MAG TPA: GNAT family N-acetyltransferase [Anaerolineales bacterium]|nr:GNAT family N-acetyltransferase [Anaerolineales bacterium]
MPILRLLPGWFGLETALLQYEKDIDGLPTFLAKDGGAVLGFLSLKQHNPYSAEVLVMGVRPEVQRGGLGRVLVQATEAYARGLGVEYLQVKTLGPSNPDPGYAKTRLFYEAMGFRPLEEFKQIWDANNPCLVMVKWIL